MNSRSQADGWPLVEIHLQVLLIDDVHDDDDDTDVFVVVFLRSPADRAVVRGDLPPGAVEWLPVYRAGLLGRPGSR